MQTEMIQTRLKLVSDILLELQSLLLDSDCNLEYGSFWAIDVQDSIDSLLTRLHQGDPLDKCVQEDLLVLSDKLDRGALQILSSLKQNGQYPTYPRHCVTNVFQLLLDVIGFTNVIQHLATGLNLKSKPQSSKQKDQKRQCQRIVYDSPRYMKGQGFENLTLEQQEHLIAPFLDIVPKHKESKSKSKSEPKPHDGKTNMNMDKKKRLPLEPLDIFESRSQSPFEQEEQEEQGEQGEQEFVKLAPQSPHPSVDSIVDLLQLFQ